RGEENEAADQLPADLSAVDPQSPGNPCRRRAGRPGTAQDLSLEQAWGRAAGSSPARWLGAGKVMALWSGCPARRLDTRPCPTITLASAFSSPACRARPACPVDEASLPPSPPAHAPSVLVRRRGGIRACSDRAARGAEARRRLAFPPC